MPLYRSWRVSPSFAGGLAAADGQYILLRGDVDLVALETRHRDSDAEMVVGDLLDIEGR